MKIIGYLYKPVISSNLKQFETVEILKSNFGKLYHINIGIDGLEQKPNEKGFYNKQIFFNEDFNT
jgi:hypothetical protein